MCICICTCGERLIASNASGHALSWTWAENHRVSHRWYSTRLAVQLSSRDGGGGGVSIDGGGGGGTSIDGGGGGTSIDGDGGGANAGGDARSGAGERSSSDGSSAVPWPVGERLYPVPWSSSHASSAVSSACRGSPSAHASRKARR